MTRILVVDDVKLFRHMEATALSWRGYDIEEASSGAEALDKIRESPPDLVLLDFYMPGMTGNEVCSQIKQNPSTKDIPVIMVTSSTRDEDIRQAVKAGCDDYLTKPLDDASLVHKVESLLGSVSKRRFPRIPTTMQISFEDFKGIFFEYSRDISRNGVFIEMENPLPEGTRLRLSFSLPAPFNKPVLAYGRVVRSVAAQKDKPGGVGISFIHVDESSKKSIDSLVDGKVTPQEQPVGVFSRIDYQLEADSKAQSESTEIRISTLATDCVELQDAIDELQCDHLRLSAMIAICEGFFASRLPKEVLEAACDVIRNLLGIASYGIFMLADDAQHLSCIASERLPAQLMSNMPIDGPIQQAIQECTVQKPKTAWPLNDAVLLMTGPIMDGDTCLGVVTLHELYTQKSTLTNADEHLLELLGKCFGRALIDSVARQHSKPIDLQTLLASF